MKENEKSNLWVRVLLSVVLLAVLIGGGIAIYYMGYNHGAIATDTGDLALERWEMYEMMPHHGYYPMMGHGYFPFGGLLFGFLFLMLVFALFRRIVFGPRWMRWGYGPYGHYRHPRWWGYPGPEGGPAEAPGEEKSAE